VTPEQLARQEIDRQLTQCSWLVQDYDDMDITASRGVSVDKYSLIGFSRSLRFPNQARLNLFRP
jgi:hypothetical protein